MNFFKETIFIICCINFLLTTSYSQTITIGGNVMNAETNEVLAYANISVQNTNYGTVTNLEGKYSISLDSASYAIKVSYIGYKSEFVKIKSTNKKLNIFLTPLSYQLDYVVVSGLTWIEQFMLSAIKAKNVQKEQLINYVADAYSKTLFRQNNLGIFGLLEAISQISYKYPDYYTENLLTYKPPPQIKNLPYRAIAINQNINLLNEYSKIKNFYIISPLNNDALKYYEYRLIRKDLIDKDTVITVGVKPILPDLPLFEGDLIFNQRNYQLIEAKLKGNNQIKDATSDSLVLFQKYEIKDSLFTLPSFTKFSLLMNFGGFPYYFEQEYTFINYKINNPENEAFISHNIPLIEKDDISTNIEFRRNKFFKVPLTLEEEKHTNIIDTVFNKAPFYRKIMLFLFTDVPSLLFDYPANIFGLNMNNFSNWYHFNKVEGHYLGAEYNFINKERIKVYSNAGYGFSSKLFTFNFLMKWNHFELDINRGFSILGDFNYNKTFQTLRALFYHTNDIYYYRSNSAVLKYTIPVTSKIYFIPTLSFERQFPAESFTEFSFFYKTRKYLPNLPIEEYNNHKAGISFEYIENIDYKSSKPITFKGKSFLNLKASYEFGSDKLLGSTENLSIWRMYLQRYQEIYNPISLDLRIFLHKQTITNYIQKLNFVNRIQATLFSEDPLSFYTLDNYEYQLENYLKIKSDLTLFHFPNIFNFQISFGIYYSFLRPLNRSTITGINPLKSNFQEYGIAFKGISFLNLYVLKNNFRSKDVFISADFSF